MGTCRRPFSTAQLSVRGEGMDALGERVRQEDRTGQDHACDSTQDSDESIAFSIASRCFWRIDEDEWTQISDPVSWKTFIKMLTLMGADADAPYMVALANPPSYEQFIHAQRHFVGGLPDSAVPVESLYVTPDQMIVHDADDGEGFWLQQPAAYMRDLVGRLGMEVPPEFSDCPDHLALELDMASMLLASDALEQAADFIPTRLEWLGRYRAKIALLAPQDLTFHAALVDALIDIASKWSLPKPHGA